MDSTTLELLCQKADNKKVFNDEAQRYVLKVMKFLKITKLGELVQLKEERLLSFTVFNIHIFFPITLQKIKDRLQRWSLTLGMSLDERLKMRIAKAIVKPLKPDSREKYHRGFNGGFRFQRRSRK